MVARELSLQGREEERAALIHKPDDQRWTWHVKYGIGYLRKLLTEDKQRGLKIARQMEEVIEKEQALADEENAERKRVKLERWRARSESTDSTTEGHGGLDAP